LSPPVPPPRPAQAGGGARRPPPPRPPIAINNRTFWKSQLRLGPPGPFGPFPRRFPAPALFRGPENFLPGGFGPMPSPGPMAFGPPGTPWAEPSEEMGVFFFATVFSPDPVPFQKPPAPFGTAVFPPIRKNRPGFFFVTIRAPAPGPSRPPRWGNQTPRLGYFRSPAGPIKNYQSFSLVFLAPPEITPEMAGPWPGPQRTQFLGDG